MGALAEFAYAADPALIMERAGMPPDPWQASILRRRAPRELLNCCRQSGKTHVVAAAVVDEVIRHPSRVLAVCPAERQSKFLIAIVSKIWSALFGDLKGEQSTTHLTFPNGSEMWALPSNEANIRGFSAISLLIVDEASRVRDELYNAVRPMLAVSKGRLLVLSTPFGKRGFFHKEWTEGEGWHRSQVTCEQCPRIGADFIAEEKRTLGELWFRQEYYCEFQDTTGALFSYEDVRAAFDEGLNPLFPHLAGADTDTELKPMFGGVV